jgi:hypothetical protein
MLISGLLLAAVGGWLLWRFGWGDPVIVARDEGPPTAVLAIGWPAVGIGALLFLAGLVGFATRR